MSFAHAVALVHLAPSAPFWLRSRDFFCVQISLVLLTSLRAVHPDAVHWLLQVLATATHFFHQPCPLQLPLALGNVVGLVVLKSVLRAGQCWRVCWGLGSVEECVEGWAVLKSVLKAGQCWRVCWGPGSVEECVEGWAVLKSVLKAGQSWRVCWGPGSVEECVEGWAVLKSVLRAGQC